MAKTIKPLSASQVEKAKPLDKEYNLFDGEGLYLTVRTNATKIWMFRHKGTTGKLYKLKIGNYPETTLAMAREKRAEYKRYIAEDKDLYEVLGKGPYRNHKFDLSVESITRKWLEHYAERKPLTAHTKHKRIRKLENHLFPWLGHYIITDVKPKHLRSTLNRIYEHSADNAQRIRADLILIFSYAVQYGYIEVNHAREMESLDLSAIKKHHPALALQKLPQLIKDIKGYEGNEITRLCLELGLHLFIRSSELRYARWNEIDLDNKQWILPAKRNQYNKVKHSDRGAKMKSPHLIPLSDHAIELLKQIKQLTNSSEIVFPSTSLNTTFISENTFNQALRRMGYDTQQELCFHGFRAMARSALGESGLFQRDAIEKQMSHQERNNVVGAYTHVAEYLHERKRMMQWWSQYLLDIEAKGFISPYDYGHQADVIQFRKSAS